MADAAQLASLADETPEGRSIVCWRREIWHPRDMKSSTLPYSFTAQTRMSGIDAVPPRPQGQWSDPELRSMALSSARFLGDYGPPCSLLMSRHGPEIRAISDEIAKAANALAVARDGSCSARALKDISGGSRKLCRTAPHGIRTVMIRAITDDGPPSPRAGVDDFSAGHPRQLN